MAPMCNAPTEVPVDSGDGGEDGETSGEFFARQAYPDVFFQAFQFESQLAARRDDWSGKGVLAIEVADDVYEIETEGARTQAGPLQELFGAPEGRRRTAQGVSPGNT